MIKKIGETRNYLLEKLKSEKFKITCRFLNHFQNFLILASTVTDSVSSSACTSLVCVPVSVTSSTVGRKICATTAGIKNCKSIIKKNKK